VQSINKILCAVDFSSSSREAFNFARSLSISFDAELELLHVAPAVNETYVSLMPDFPGTGVYQPRALQKDS